MYNILIADDESYQRFGMEKIIRRLRPEFRIFTSADGREAFDILQNEEIHIAFIDVIMPHMDGIRLVERFHPFRKNTRLIIVSAYKDFTYAQRALQMGVFDYIVKPIQPEAISSLLQKVESDLSEEKNKLSERRHLENQLSYTLPVYHGHLLNHWIMDTGKMPEYVAERLMNKRFGLVIIASVVQTQQDVPFEPHDGGVIKALIGLFEDRFQTAGRRILSFKIESEETRIAIVAAADTKEQLDAKLLADLSREAILDIENRCHCLCALGIGGEVDSIYEHAKYSYRQAETALKYLFYTGYRTVLFHQNITQKHVSALDAAQKDQLALAVREYDMEKVRQTIHTIYMNATTDGYIRPQHFVHTINMWVLDILELFRHLINSENFNTFHDQINTGLLKDKTFVEYSEHITTILNDLIETIKAGLQNKNDRIMKDCIAYLQQNFNKDLSLNEVAANCYLSASYFSILFKQYTGTTLNQYILELRMNRAKELLSRPDTKIYEIALTLGYRDTKYFHRIFKRYYKLTPQEYKTKLRNVDKK